MRLLGYVACAEEVRNRYKILVWKHHWRDYLEDLDI